MHQFALQCCKSLTVFDTFEGYMKIFMGPWAGVRSKYFVGNRHLALGFVVAPETNHNTSTYKLNVDSKILSFTTNNRNMSGNKKQVW